MALGAGVMNPSGGGIESLVTSEIPTKILCLTEVFSTSVFSPFTKSVGKIH